MTKTKRSPYRKKAPKPSTRLPSIPPNKNHGDKKKYDRKKKEPAPELDNPQAEDLYERTWHEDMWE